MTRRILLVVAALALLVAGALVAAVLLIDPNDYRDEIASMAREHTGRELRIPGELSLSVFPWLGVELGEVILEQAPGFGPEPFARAEKGAVRVRLLPLLRGNVEVDTIVLRGLELRLETDENGRTNWEDLAAAAAGGEAPPPEPGDVALALPAALSVGGLELRDSTVRWIDRQAGTDVVAHRIELTSGRIEAGRPVDLALALGLRSTEPAVQGEIGLQSRITLAGDGRRVTAEDTRLRARLAGEAVPTGEAALEIEADIAADLAAETITVSSLEGRLIDTDLKGEASVKGFSQPAIRFSLEAGELDLDRYLPGADVPAAAAPAAPAAALPLPPEQLRALDLQGRLAVVRLRSAGMRLEDIDVEIDARAGLIRVAPIGAALYGGRYDGKAVLDARTDTPSLAIEGTLAGVDAEPLLADAADIDLVRGKADVRLDLRARGTTETELRKTLAGTAEFAFRDGAIKGFNVARLVREAKAALKGGGAARGGEQEDPETDFTELTGTLVAGDGWIRNEDLRGLSPYLRLSGRGGADLVGERVDYRLVARIVDSPAGQGADLADLRGLDVPVRVTGSWDSPSIRLDGDFLKERLGDRLLQELGKELGTGTGDRDELEQRARERLEDEVQRKLRGLFR